MEMSNITKETAMITEAQFGTEIQQLIAQLYAPENWEWAESEVYTEAQLGLMYLYLVDVETRKVQRGEQESNPIIVVAPIWTAFFPAWAERLLVQPAPLELSLANEPEPVPEPVEP